MDPFILRAHVTFPTTKGHKGQTCKLFGVSSVRSLVTLSFVLPTRAEFES